MMTSTPTPERLAAEIESLDVRPGTAALVWLGQGGWLIKSHAGITAMIDPYFSDWAEQTWGMKRMIPAVLDPASSAPDVLLITHWHEDHLDAPTIRRYIEQPRVRLAGPASCVVRAIAWGWPEDRTSIVERGDRITVGDLEATATFARHDEEVARTDDAVGFLINAAGVRIWNVADSEYDSRLLSVSDAGIDVMLVPINGVGGNMNAHAAALLVWQVQPRIAIPMHYDMWAPEAFGPGATLDPAMFIATLERLGGGPETRVMTAGEIVIIEGSGAASQHGSE
jgi:L-ascorbate 6-phosphate lactonase